MFGKHAGETCSGVCVHVLDSNAFRPLRTYVAILWAVRRLAGGSWRWRTEAYEFRSDVPAIDLLWGGAELRQAIDSGAGAREVLALPDAAEAAWDPAGLLLY
jgi:uncharacterized protein YbbC (DUF1343 family)